uniref:Alpha-amylase n=1 Tax=Solanum tuberosum TaxID=4113 RepID=M1BHN5_SOLTU
MDHNQDPHRQRIIDWINATNGTAGAFDVTTKGILHSVSFSNFTPCTVDAILDRQYLIKGRIGKSVFLVLTAFSFKFYVIRQLKDVNTGDYPIRRENLLALLDGGHLVLLPL